MIEIHKIIDTLQQYWTTSFIFKENTHNLRNFQIILNKNKNK